MRQKQKSKNTQSEGEGVTLPAAFDSMQSAAGALTIPIWEIKADKAAGCAGFRGGRVYTADYLEWRRAQPDRVRGGEMGGEDADERRAQERHSLMMMKLKLEVEKEKGNLLHKDDVKREIATSSEAIMETLSRVLDKETYNIVIRDIKAALLEEGARY